MNILITNDDGIRAPGIRALHEAIVDPDGRLGGPICDKWMIVAPLTVQSASSHGITYSSPLMVTEEEIEDDLSGTAVDGRPADCTKLALTELWPQRFGEGSLPDLVISGVNAGANIGINILYSGTVAAAIEGAFLGVPAIAISLHLSKDRVNWHTAARVARHALARIIDHGIGEHGAIRPHDCINVNLPLCTDAPIDPPTPDEPELTVCPMNVHPLNDEYDARQSPSGIDYYWASGHGLDFRNADEGTDVKAVLERRISVTPLRFDLTHHEQLDSWHARLSGGHVPSP